MDIHELERHLSAGEGLMLEFKRCGGVPGKDTFETICSFANRQGGNLFLGVNDSGDITGVPPKSAKSISRNIVNTVSNPVLFNVPPVVETETIETSKGMVIRVWVPVGPAVYSYKGVAYDRIADADVKVVGIEQMSLLYLRKQNEYSERRIYQYVSLADFRRDLIARAREMALMRTPSHPWGRMTDEELLRSAKLYGKNRTTGQEGYTLAAVLLFGTDEVISDVCPAYRTDGIVRIEDLDRYDDRITTKTNLIEAYDLLTDFVKHNIPDRFILEGERRVSARDILVRELTVNLLIHREFISPFPAKIVIDRSELRTENASRSMFEGRISLDDFNPISKNPNIAGVFSQIGLAEELGSGFRKLQKYSMLFSGKPAALTDGDIFRATVPLTPISASKGKDGVLSAAYLLVERDGTVTSTSLANYMGVTTRTAQRYIRQLVKTGSLVSRQGSPRSYVVR